MASGIVALGGSALLFAAVHVTVYGLWVLPLDLAAGLLLGWQRQVTGSWAVPAVTHALANLLVVLCGERATQPVINTGTIYQ